MPPGTEAAGTQDCFTQLERGARVEGYLVRRVLSRGNGGALHQARGEGGTRVLLRVLSPRARTPEVRARIDAELDRLERVDHRCVSRLVARGPEHFALEHPGGLTLLELVRRGKPFDAAEVVWVGHGLASGLLALHAAGLAHGNVSPSAIHVTEDGPVLIDLGWPARLGQGTPPTPAGDVRSLASTLTFAIVGAPTEAGEDDKAQAAGLPREVASLLRTALDTSAPAPALDKVRRVFERAADKLGLLDQGGAPASLGRRLREAIRLHLASSASGVAAALPGGDDEEEPTSSSEATAEATALAAGPPVVSPLLVDSLAFEGASDSDAPALPEGGPQLETKDSDDPARAVTERRAVVGEPPPIRTVSGRVVGQNPFASAGEAAAPPSGTGSAETEVPDDLELRLGLELIHRRVLGQGGMGVVHLVLDPRLGRRAALKLLRTPVTPSRVRRFRRETVVTARLDHPGIPPVYEAGTTPAGTHYLLMRFVEGESLAEVLTRRQTQQAGWSRRERDRQARELLHALVKVGEAVAYAHSKGIVHRDLKPANIMVGAFGEVLVMDWGLARDLHESSDEDAWIRNELGMGPPPEPVGDRTGITQDGAILGTPGYLAPEQARGEDVDARADVFSLGAVLCEILTGRPPVIGPTALAVLGLTRGGEVEFPHQRYVTVDPELDAIATRALAPDAGARYPTAEAFADDLRAYLEGENVSAYSYRLTERAWRAVRRHPALATVVTVAVTFLVWTTYLKERARLDQETERHAQAQVVNARVTALLADAQAALQGEAHDKARTLFAQALALDAGSDRARLGLDVAERALARAAAEQEQRAEADRLAREAEQARTFVLEGDRRLQEGDLQAALSAYLKASAFTVVPEEARQGLKRVEQGLLELKETERQAAFVARDAGEAARHLAEGRAHLQAGRARPARESALKALAFGSAEAPDLLRQVDDLLAEERGREIQEELDRREAGQAERLAQQGAAALAAGELEDARTAFIQALGFDGRSEAARKGLLDADRALMARAEAARLEDVRRERVRRVRAKQEQARAALVRARELDRGGRALEAREQFLAALDLLDQALFMLPDDKAARADKVAAARELAQHLFEDGHQELGVFVLRLAGVEQAGEASAIDPLRDPHLVVVEADRVRIAHAFDGAVRFQPSHGFDRLRDYVKQFGGRYRVTVQVRSEATLSNPPRVHATGFWVRVEDRQSNTVHPTIKIAFSGGPYVRPVTVDPTGRTVAPFERALSLETERWVREVEGHLKRIFEPPSPGAPDGD